MKHICLLTLLLVPVLLFAQETKKTTDSYRNEVYYVLKSDKSIKHGSYIRYDKYLRPKTTILKGIYKSGVKDSIWNAYGPKNKLLVSYDYTNKKLLYFEGEQRSKDSIFTVINGTDSIKTKLTNPPIFLNAIENLRNGASYNFIFPFAALKNKAGGKVIVYFTVNTDGKAVNYHTKDIIGYGLDEEAVRAVKAADDGADWLPGVLDGKPVDVELSITIKLYVFGDRSF